MRRNSVGELAVRAQDITRTYGSTIAVNSLNLTVPTGAVFGLIGPNGAGKSTAIRLLLGLLKPSSGRATVLGFDTVTEADRIRERSGAVLETCSLYGHLSALENLEFYGRIWRMPAAERRARARQLLGRLGLWDRRGELIQSWSRDLRQRLCIARSIFHRPSILFLDEPTAGLDPLATASIQRDLAEAAATEAVTIVLTTNNLTQAEALCTHVAVINRGVLLAGGPIGEICTAGVRPQLEIIGRGFTDEVVALLARRPEIAAINRLDNGLALDLIGNVDTAPLVSLLVESSADVEEVKKNRVSLQAAFTSLVQQSRRLEKHP